MRVVPIDARTTEIRTTELPAVEYPVHAALVRLRDRLIALMDLRADA